MVCFKVEYYGKALWKTSIASEVLSPHSSLAPVGVAGRAPRWALGGGVWLAGVCFQLGKTVLAVGVLRDGAVTIWTSDLIAPPVLPNCRELHGRPVC